MFTNLTNSLSLSQHVNFPTHINGNIIDLVFSSSLHSELMVSNISIEIAYRLDLLSDHFLISFKTNFTITLNQKTRITYRPIKNINSMIFLADLHSALGDYCYSPVVLNSILSHLIDKHAPSKTISVTLHPDTPWFTSHLMSLKRSLRKSERIYISLRSSSSRASFIEQRKIYKLAISYAKSSYYTQVINDLASDNRRLFRLANKLLSPPKPALLPSMINISPLQLSCLFSKTFSNKIDSIIIKINNHTLTANYPSIIVTPPISVFLSFFRPPHISLISKLLNASSSISPSDPVPLSIFKLYSDYLCPTICNIISYSLNSGTVPSIFKQAIITPILKKPSLDPDSLLNYRPISQLPLVSKILERVVSRQLISYLTANNLHIPQQSGFRRGHSTETALLNVIDVITSTIYTKNCCQLVMLDISSAFDTLDHNILLSRLHLLGVRDLALSWFTSYLFDRSSSVKIYNSLSSPSPMKYGVPQGSVLGPSLFSIYLYPLPSIISKYPNIYYHLYADDIQLYMFLPTNSSPGLNNQLSNCANDIKEWLISNNLLLNTSKTKLLNLSPSPTYFPPFLIDNIVISPSPTASNLGVIFDSTLSFIPHITAITKSANYHLFRIRKIRKSITVSLTKTLVNSLVLSRIDYCSSILINLPLSSISSLNRVIRSSIRTTYNLRIRDHSSTSSYQHLSPWFTFNKRSAYRILSIVHSSIYSSNCPSYISASLVKRAPLPSLRNHASHLLSTPILRPSKMNTRALSYIGPKL